VPRRPVLCLYLRSLPRHDVPSPCAHDYRLFSGASDCIPMQPSTGTSCACRSASQFIYPVLLLLPRVMGAATSQGVEVKIAPFDYIGQKTPLTASGTSDASGASVTWGDARDLTRVWRQGTIILSQHTRGAPETNSLMDVDRRVGYPG